MWYRVKDLSTEQRLVLESLIGRDLSDEEELNIHPDKVSKPGPPEEEPSKG